MAVQMPPRLASRKVENDEPGAIRRAVCDVRIARPAEVEAHVVDRGVGIHHIRRERVRGEVGAVEVEADELGTAGDGCKQVRAINLRTAGVERPDAIEPVDDDGLYEKELLGRDAVARVGLVRKGWWRVPLFTGAKESACAHERCRRETYLGHGASVVGLVNTAKV